jgi:DNA-binding SARP family transcriptional activator
MGFCRLAALEVAASLLALGDCAAARAWVESVAGPPPPGHEYHALRSDMILAEIARREGDVAGALGLVAKHAEHIISENSNWQIAMYCRSFPELLGIFGQAVGAGNLPEHMLRMILPEFAEASLVRTKGFIEEATWKELGLRLLGDVGFSEFLARDGLPLCHVRLFGGLEISVGGRMVRERDWKKRKARLLFAMLVIRRGQDVPRDQVFEHLWPDMDTERAKNNLYVIWSTMKSALATEYSKSGKSPYVESVGGVCRITRQAVRSDLDEMEECLSRAKDADANGDMANAVRAFERVAELYRGDLLPGDIYDDWFASLRDHYRIVFVDSMLRATQILLDADDPVGALVFARKAIRCDPLREDLYQCALRCQIAAGQRSGAIDTYFQCRSLLTEELGLDPSPETRALYDEILAMENRPRPILGEDPLGCH